MGVNKHIEWLRAWLHEPPTEEGWKRICDFLATLPQKELYAPMVYAQEHLKGWPAPFQGVRPMWEYKIIELPARTQVQQLEETFKELGSDGWELTMTERRGGQTVTALYHFKRRVFGDQPQPDEHQS